MKDLIQVTLGISEGESFQSLKTLTGRDIIGTICNYPLYPRSSSILAGESNITTETGIDLVHTTS